MGASSHSNTSTSKSEKEEDESNVGLIVKDEGLKSCCQKSCNK